MKIRILTLIFVATVINKTYCATLSSPVHIMIKDDTSMSDVEVSGDADDTIRIKRSGSGSPDFFGYIKRGITSKISQIAQASAGASAHFSKGSSNSGGGGGGGGGYYYPEPHDPPITYGSKTFDFWALKKSILNTLLQAVKAINGGIIAIKGQLIKGSGAIISAKGRLISMKGEAISNLGKHIITNAKLSPSYHSKPIHIISPTAHTGPSITSHPSASYGPPSPEYGPPSSVSAPSGPSSTAGFPDHPPPSTYGAPTVSAYGPPIGPSASAPPSQAYLPQKHYAGIVILKKIPKDLKSEPTGIASLPLQDERKNKAAPTLFTPEASPSAESPIKPPPVDSYSNTYINYPPNPLFESALKPVPTPEASYGSPVDAPPTGSGHKQEPLISSYSPDQHFPHSNEENLYLSKLPAPFEISSYGNSNDVPPSLPGPVKTDFATLDQSAFNVGSNVNYPPLDYKEENFNHHKGAFSDFDVVKSVAYELPALKRH